MFRNASELASGLRSSDGTFACVIR